MANANSLANLNPNKPYPVGHKVKTRNGYWRVKVPDDYPYTQQNHWAYVHVSVAEQNLDNENGTKGRKLAPNERVYFKNKNAKTLKDPSPGDLEVRIIAIQSGKPPGKRKYLVRQVLELRAKLEQKEAELAAVNEFYGRKPDDVSGAFETREWSGK